MKTSDISEAGNSATKRKWAFLGVLVYLLGLVVVVTIAYRQSVDLGKGTAAGLILTHLWSAIATLALMRLGRRSEGESSAAPGAKSAPEPSLTLSALLDTLDCLERATAAAVADVGVPVRFTDGLLMIETKLLHALHGVGIDTCNAVGERFDPQFHDAIAVMTQVGLPPRTVVWVQSRGYRHRESGQILRHAQVGVTPAAEAPSSVDMPGSTKTLN